ncbi:MAG: polysaccharide biosynthesis protein [Clostridia bacterium]|nr:polysaccharide biosynthesis protein [Clostridia bacterium]
MITKTNQRKWGASLSYIQMALNIIIGIVYTPIMIRLLGDSEYGLYNTVASTITMLSVLNLGFNAGYVRYYTKYNEENNKESIYKLNGLFLLILSVLGIIALICGLFMTFNLELVFDEGLTTQEYEIARVLMLLLTINLAISFPMGTFSSIISTHENYIVLRLLGMLKTVVGPLVTIPILLMGFRSIAVVSVTLGVSLITDTVYFIYVKFKLKQKFIFHGFEKGIFKSIFIYTSFIAIQIIVDQINLNIDKFLLGRLKGTFEVSLYSAGFSLYLYYMMFSTSISGVFIPKMHRTMISTQENIQEQKSVFTSYFIKVGRIQFLILALIASGFVFFGKPFIYYWAGDGYGVSYYVALFLILTGSIDLIQNLGIEIQRAQNKHKFRSIVYLIMAVFNLILSIFMCQKYGAVGAAIGTAISFLLANGLVMNIYYHKRCNIDIIAFWKNILRISLGLILPIGAGIILNYFVDLYNIWYLFGAIIIYSVIYCISMWFIGMNSYEKDIIRKPIKKIISKLKH